MSLMKCYFTVLITIFIFLSTSSAYDNDDYEIFDLYEEVNGTFYELLEISQAASSAEIKRAYRKLSLKLHPDKNDSPNAEEQFRILVAVYEILKDPQKREKYENVLKNGLPDWRNPVFYYRKYRKMGNFEVSIIVALISTIGHYLVWWVAYLEKQFEMEEILAPLRKRNEKKKAKGKLVEESGDLSTEELLIKELGYRRPSLTDLLPFVIVRSVFYFIKSIPRHLQEAKERRSEEIRIKKEEEQIARELAEAVKAPKPKRTKPKIELRDASEFEHEEEMKLSMLDQENPVNVEKKSVKEGKWETDDYAALAKLMAKFPGGTPLRWDRIAHELGRSKEDVTKIVKNMKSSLSSHQTSESVYANSDELVLKKKQTISIDDEIVTRSVYDELKKTEFVIDNDQYKSQYDIPDDYDEGFSPLSNEEPEIDYTVVKKKVKTRPVENENKPENETEVRNSAKEEEEWTQIQQKCLEAAIAQFPKSTSNRWTCIAGAVPNKNKDQCIERYKFIAEQVKERKLKKEKGS